MRVSNKTVEERESEVGANALVKTSKAPRSRNESPTESLEIEPTLVEQASQELPDYEDTSSESKYGRHILSHLLSDKRILVLVGILIFGLMVWTAAPPLYQKLKVRRAMDFLEQSRTAADEGNVPKAIALMRKAILIAPNNEDVFRKIRLFNAKIGDPAALNELQGLMIDKLASTEELVVLAEQALRSDNTTIAKTALDQLGDDQSVQKTIIQMRLLQKEGNLKDALELPRQKLAGLNPSDAEKLLLATADMTLKSDMQASRQILIQLINNDSPIGIAALRLLAQQQLLRPTPADTQNDKVADKILTHRLHTPDDALLALDLQIRENPAAKPALLSQMATVRMAGSPDDAMSFARWMNRRLHHKETIKFIGRERASSNLDWLLIYLDALAGMEQWNEIFSLLDAETVSGLSDSIRLLFLARAAKNSGDEGRSDECWRELHLGLMYEKPEVVSFVAAYALRIGEREEAMKAYKTMSRRRETALEGFLGLIRCSPKNTPAGELLPIYKELTQEFPMLAEAQNDLAYLKLLTDEDLNGTAAMAKEIQKTDPPTLASLSIASLALLKTGYPEEADAIYDGKTISWNSAPAPWKVVRAAVLHAAGKKAEARELAATIGRAQLRPEEIALLPSDEQPTP
jgi:tetratricopeptide (TPR) repeat protein